MTGVAFIQDLGIVLLVAGLIGWVFSRMGLSVVVGYLLAGIIVGPFTPPFPLVDDIDRIQTLANVGLVFLMFSIGMGLSFTRLQRLGLPVVVATALIAFLLFNGWRMVGSLFGLTPVQSLFFAGMWVSSSSAIIGKVLQERGLTHQKNGQLALAVTVLEDTVAIIVLTLLLSYVGIGEEDAKTVVETIGIFGALVIFVAISGLLLVPRLLGFLGRRAGVELQTLVVGAVLMLLAVLAQRAGYSLALGAFLLGAIVAETPQRTQVENAFAGLRHVFSAVFFVAIGMLIDVAILGDVWLYILGISAMIIVGRVLVAGFAFTVIGIPPKEGVRAGLALTPMGEFGFIIAQAGIAAAVVPTSFYPIAVGVSLITALACPLLVSRSDAIADLVEKLEPAFLRRGIAYYHNWLDRLSGSSGRGGLWKLSRKRILQIGLGVFFISGLTIAADPVYRLLLNALGPDLLFPHGTTILFWGTLGIVALFPLLAIWRNISAVAMIVAEVTSRGRQAEKVLPFVVEHVVKAVGFLALLLWIWAILPLGVAALWVFGVVVVIAIILVILFRRRLVFVHSQFEAELRELMSEGHRTSSRELPPWLKSQKDFHLNINELRIPENGACGGQTIGQLALRTRVGCSIVGIDRQGLVIGTPGPGTVLYPGDRVLLLGSREELEQAGKILTETREGDLDEAVALEDVQLETVVVPLDSPRIATLAELDINRVTGVQVAGIQRQNQLRVNPGGDEMIRPGDELLVLGSPGHVKQFRRWLMPVKEATPNAESR